MSQLENYIRIITPVTLNFYLQVTQEKTEHQPMQGYLLSHPSIAQENTYPPRNAVREPLPYDLPAGKINFWNGNDWEVHSDHRQVMDEYGRVIAGSGTPYWLKTDNWQTPARYLDVAGPFPDGVLLKQPVEPDPTFTEIRDKLLEQLAADVKTSETSGFTMSVLGFEIDATERSYTDTQGLITKMTDKGIEKELFCDHQNNFHEVTLMDIKTIHLEIIEHGQAAYARKWKIRTLILSIHEDEREVWRDRFAEIKSEYLSSSSTAPFANNWWDRALNMTER